MNSFNPLKYFADLYAASLVDNRLSTFGFYSYFSYLFSSYNIGSYFVGSYNFGSYSFGSYSFGSYNIGSYNFGSFGTCQPVFYLDLMSEAIRQEPLNLFGYGMELI